VLAPDCALLEYHSANDTTWLFVVAPGDVRCVDLAIGSDALHARVRRLVAPMCQAGKGAGLAGLDAFDLGLARRMFTRLVTPALKLLPSSVDHLVIVSDGALHDLPFDLLAWPQREDANDFVARFGDARYLADSHRITHVPSSLLLSPRSSGDGAPKKVVAVAHSPKEGACVGMPLGSQRVRALLGARTEARHIAALSPGAVLLDGSSATLEAVASSARGADILHIAAHGHSDRRAPGLSGVVLADPRGGSEFVTAERLAAACRARLVVLSACESVAGRTMHREGALSLERSLLRAGVERVIASRWLAEDRATSRLMVRLHEELAIGVPAADAMSFARRAERRAARKKGDHSVHPFFWAGFRLTDARPG